MLRADFSPHRHLTLVRRQNLRECHAEGGLQGLNISTYDTLLQGGTSGPAVVPGNPEGSLLVQRQRGEQAHFGQLNPEELELVIEWIEIGAP